MVDPPSCPEKRLFESIGFEISETLLEAKLERYSRDMDGYGGSLSYGGTQLLEGSGKITEHIKWMISDDLGVHTF